MTRTLLGREDTISFSRAFNCSPLFWNRRTLIDEQDWLKPKIENGKTVIPELTGVYLLVKVEKGHKSIVYIGSAENLKKRLRSHDVYRTLSRIYEMEIFLKVDGEMNYLEYEKFLIKEVNPKFNSQHRTSI